MERQEVVGGEPIIRSVKIELWVALPAEGISPGQILTPAWGPCQPLQQPQ